MKTPSNRAGFTLIELLLVIAIIGLIATIAMFSQRYSNEKRNDLRRVTDVAALEKGLALYMSYSNGYPVMTGCISGTDLVTAALRGKGVVGADEKITDPTSPSDPAKCYYYTSTGSDYRLRFTLEADSSAGKAGVHTISP